MVNSTVAAIPTFTTIPNLGLDNLAEAAAWPRFLLCLLVPLVFGYMKLAGPLNLNLPTLPSYSPKRWDAKHWPLVGSALSFYTKRRDFVFEGTHANKPTSGLFSFFIGQRHVVSMGGEDARKTFFENKEFSVSQGFVELLTGLVSSHDARDDYGAALFVRHVAALSRAERLSAKLPVFTSDARDFVDELKAGEPSKNDSRWSVTDVNKSVYLLLYRLVQRSVGATEMANNRKLLESTLAIFEVFERSSSLFHIIFPWMITPAYIARMIAGARLYITIKNIVDTRKKSDIRVDDSLQYVYETEPDLDKVVRFIFSALSSSVTMTGAAVTWMAGYLASAPEWLDQCKIEVDASLRKHRTSPSQSANDILQTLTLQDWENEFPVLYMCLQETLRITSTGTFFRKNVSGSPIAIGETGLSVPNNSYAAFLPDSVHMDPRRYPSPLTFNPGRFANRRDDEKDPHTFLGWGSGRHLCAGMRIAKLEINMIMVHMIANFDFELSDKEGRPKTGAELPVDRNLLRPEHSHYPIYVRYKSRE